MKNVKMRILAALLASTMLIGATACGTTPASSSSADSESESSSASEGEDSSSEGESSGEKVVITYPTYQVGTHVGAPLHEAQMALFEEMYGDEIELEIEELPTDSAYADKLKVLAATNELPDVVDGKNGVRDLAVQNGQAMDWTDELAADPEFAAEIGQAAIDATTYQGGVYSISNALVSVGYFYNKEMFDAVGIKPAETWEEYMENCEKLLAGGYTPVALMTGENSWTTNLILASMVGTNGEAGNEFMNTQYPETYNTPEMIEALTMMETMLQKYTTPDAVGAIYANAANSFCQEQTAMIANGAWMSSDFSNPEKSPEGFEEKVGFAVYPENGLISNFDIGFVVNADTPETIDASIKLTKLLTDAEGQALRAEMLNVVPLTDVEISQEVLERDVFFAELLEARKTVDYQYMNFDLSAYPAVVDAFGQYYPELAYDVITPEEMVLKLDEAAASAKAAE